MEQSNRQIHSPHLKKAYLIALCLQATRVLAEVPEGQAVEEKALLARVMDAIKHPGAEHLPIYVGLGFALAVIAGIVFMALGKKETTLKVTLDDVASSAEPEETTAKTGRRSRESAMKAAASQSKKEKEGDKSSKKSRKSAKKESS